jgi:hypothetical protein
MQNFHIDIAVERIGSSDFIAPSAVYSTDSVIDFAEYMASAMVHFRSMLRFEKNVIGVSMLIRMHHDHKVVNLSINEETGAIDMQEN